VKTPEYAGLSTRVKWVLGVIAVSVLVAVVGIVYDVLQLLIVLDVANGMQISVEEADSFDAIMGNIGALQLLLWVIRVIVFLTWKYGAFRNLASFHVHALKYSAGEAVGAYFIPILGYYRPLQVMREMWKASDPTNLETEESAGLAWMRSSCPSIVIWWWIVFAVDSVFGWALLLGVDAEELDALVVLSWALLFSDVLTLVSFALTCCVVYKVSNMQSEKHAMMQSQVVME